MKEKGFRNLIRHVVPGGIAEEMGIEPEDVLIAINGREIEDMIEYKFCISDEYLEVEIEKPSGERWVLEIEKDYDEDLGFDFENPLLSHMKSCHNRCVFCFIDQLPPGMRESLYFKDDDSRMSFLHGNYITLTNMKAEEVDKIIRYRISPLNVSVHTTDGELRKRMLNNRFAGNILETLTRLAENQIQMNCQIVLCPAYNDGEALDKTLRDLEKLHNAIQSIAVVPVGLTRYREQLAPVQAFDPAAALETVKQIHGWQRHFRRKFNRNYVHLSDEFYLLAKVPLPEYNHYEGFVQLENGVGMMVKLRNEFEAALAQISSGQVPERRVALATGELAFSYIKELARLAQERYRQLDIQVLQVKNRFFGGQVAVSGLLTGQDIVEQVSGQVTGRTLILAENMLKAEETVFLDDMTVEEMADKLGCPIEISPVTGEAFVQRLLGI